MNLTYLALIIGLAFVLISNAKTNKNLQNLNPQIEENKTEIDSAVSFGYKCIWLAVKTTDKEKIAELLKLKNKSECNWKVGISKAYENSIYITPSINKWTLICGLGLPTGDNPKSIKEIKSILQTLSKEFGEAQFFATHRVVEYHFWMKATNGNIDRAYSFIGESLENLIVEGKPTEIEKKYNLINTLSKEAEEETYFDREDLETPDEDFVMMIAENWSINPTRLEERKDITPGLGIVGIK